MKKYLVITLLVALVMAWHLPALAGKIVVNNDEWPLSDSGFFAPNDPGVFATNVAAWFLGGSGTGKFHAYSTNLGLTGSSLATAMANAGHTWTTGTGITFNLSTLQTYNGIFLGGDSADNNVLIQYVEAGGNVYLMGGTGWGGAPNEAARWNTFLNHFGLQFASSYNGVSGNIAISSTHPIFAGVDSLWQGNGQDVSDILPADPRNQILVSLSGHGLYAVYDSAIPVPPAVWLLGSGLVGLLGWRRVSKD